MLGAFDGGGLDVPEEFDAFVFGVVVLEGEGGHLLGAAAIEHHDLLGAEPDGCDGGVDGGVAGADDGGAAGHPGERAVLVAGDDVERVGDAGELLAGDAEAMDGAQADAEEDRRRAAASSVARSGCVDDGVEVELDAEPGDHVDFAQDSASGSLYSAMP